MCVCVCGWVGGWVVWVRGGEERERLVWFNVQFSTEERLSYVLHLQKTAIITYS